MRFFRRRSSLGFLALLAVAMQAVLAFAETHVHSQAVVDKLATRAVTYGACAPRALHPCAPSTPHDDRGNCPVCGAVNLATAAILDQPPAVLTPPARFPAPALVRVIHAVGGDDSVHFQARAPPALLMS
jgi:hypothetical protein